MLITTYTKDYKVKFVRLGFLILIYLFITKIGVSQIVEGNHNHGVTNVFIIRHAEQEQHPTKYQPQVCLSQEGKERSRAFVEYAKFLKFDAYYTSSNSLTEDSIQPLLESRKADNEMYDRQNLVSLSDKIIKENKGKNILVVCQREDMLEFIEVLGGRKPIPMIGRDDYSFVFKVTIQLNGDVKVYMDQYKSAHHTFEE